MGWFIIFASNPNTIFDIRYGYTSRQIKNKAVGLAYMYVRSFVRVQDSRLKQFLYHKYTDFHNGLVIMSM